MDHSVAYAENARPTDDSPISKSRIMLSEEIGRLREAVAMFEARLSDVLGPIRPLDVATTLRPDADEVSPMAANIADAAGGVREQVDYLLAIARRLEL